MNYNNDDFPMVQKYNFVNYSAEAAACSPINSYPQPRGDVELDCAFKPHCNKLKDVDCSCEGSVNDRVGGCNCFQKRDLQWWIGSM